MSTKHRVIEILVLSGLASTGCAQNALLFHETTKFSFTAEYKPDSSQPLSSSLGYKRRIVAVVPPKEPVSQEHANNPQATHKGEALSLVSTFDVEAKGVLGVTIKNYIASGRAATAMTSQDDAKAAASIRALFAPATLVELPEGFYKLQLALQNKLGKLNEEEAKRVLDTAKCDVQPGWTAMQNLQLCIVRARNDEALTRLEAAFTRLPDR